MVVKKSCVAANPVGWPDGRGISGRMRVEWVVRCSWNGWPDDRGIRNLAGRHGVHCRIGSAEKLDWMREGAFFVHCRIGSSEIGHQLAQALAEVHCRIGSSEKDRRQARRRQ